jgi:dethiobiotin synthetase
MKLNLNLPKANGLFITGTDTGVGKTLVAGAIARILTDAKHKVGVFKPIATGCRRDWDGLISEDTEFLAFCSRSELPFTTITPVGYLTPAAPIVSAAQERRPIDFTEMTKAYNQICSESDFVIVEGIGGVRVPLTTEIDVLDLAGEFAMPVVIVTRPDLGTINHTLMTIDCVRAAGLNLAGVVVSGFNATEASIAEDTADEVIAQCGNVPILAAVPFDETLDITEPNIGEVIVPSLQGCDWANLGRI